jgi:hypothetical protein
MENRKIILKCGEECMREFDKQLKLISQIGYEAWCKLQEDEEKEG